MKALKTLDIEGAAVQDTSPVKDLPKIKIRQGS
jgi:hypothetical protein